MAEREEEATSVIGASETEDEDMRASEVEDMECGSLIRAMLLQERDVAVMGRGLWVEKQFPALPTISRVQRDKSQR